MRRVLFVLAVLLASPAARPHAAPAAADGVSIRGAAGLGGVARAGRWTAVEVTIENSGAPSSGNLVVAIGDAKVVRHVEVPSPSKKRTTVYLRVPADADAAATVTFASSPPVRIPLRLYDGDAPLTICVGPASADCTASLDADAAPQSWRGYDAADVVVLPPDVRFTAPQQAAYDRWRAIRHWSESTNMVPPPAPATAFEDTSRASRMLLLYVASMLALAVIAPLVRKRSAWTHGAVVATIVAASTAVLADGRFGNAAAIAVRDSTVVRAGVGFDSASVSARGVALFPAAARHELETPLEDGSLEVAGGPAFRKGQRVAFDVEGFAAGRLLESDAAASGVTLRNVSSFTFTNCVLPDGYVPRTIDRLVPQASATVTAAADAFDPVMTCGIDGTIETLAVPGARLQRAGSTTLLYDLRPRGGRP